MLERIKTIFPLYLVINLVIDLIQHDNHFKDRQQLLGENSMPDVLVGSHDVLMVYNDHSVKLVNTVLQQNASYRRYCRKVRMVQEGRHKLSKFKEPKYISEKPQI